jgi:hypothetical protein
MSGSTGSAACTTVRSTDGSTAMKVRIAGIVTFRRP